MSVSQSVREPIADADVSILGLLPVFDHAARVGVKRMIFASSGGTLYGDISTAADSSLRHQQTGVDTVAGTLLKTL